MEEIAPANTEGLSARSKRPTADGVGADVADKFLAAVVSIFRSDEGMEDGRYESEALRRFVSVKIEGIPDETTICKFRHYLEKHELTERLFALSGRHLANQGLLWSPGSIVDASIIAAPSSTKNLNRQRDQEMKQTKKGKPWYFGMKMPIGTDTEGAVHAAVGTNAAVHDA